MYVCMYVCMIFLMIQKAFLTYFMYCKLRYVCMYVCMYVYICLPQSLHSSLTWKVRSLWSIQRNRPTARSYSICNLCSNCCKCPEIFATVEDRVDTWRKSQRERAHLIRMKSITGKLITLMFMCIHTYFTAHALN